MALGLAMVVLYLGRGVDSRATVQIAAETAAQAAVQERTIPAALSAGERAALSMLVDDHTCRSPDVRIDATEFRPGGVVSVTVTCSVSAAGLELIDPPLDVRSATAFATVDPLRAAEGQP